jgi:hypothetical protein
MDSLYHKKKLLTLLLVVMTLPLPFVARAHIQGNNITVGPITYGQRHEGCTRWYCDNPRYQNTLNVNTAWQSDTSRTEAHDYIPSTYTPYTPTYYNPGPNQPDGDSAWSKVGYPAW